jgi:recombination DNA repair RAD52 pathway protein
VVVKKVKDNFVPREVRPPSFVGFEHTVNAVLMLWDDLIKNKDISYLLTNRLTQDAIEHEFSICRHKGGYVKNPTALQFRQNLRHRIQVTLMKPPSTSNCEVDVVEEIPTLTMHQDPDIEKINDTDEEDDTSTTSDPQSEESFLGEPDEDEFDCDEPTLSSTQSTPMEVVVHEEEHATLESCSIQ